MDREDLSAGTPRPDPNAKAKHQSNILNKRPAGGGRGGREKKVVRPLSDSASGGEGPRPREAARAVELGWRRPSRSRKIPRRGKHVVILVVITTITAQPLRLYPALLCVIDAPFWKPLDDETSVVSGLFGSSDHIRRAGEHACTIANG